MQIRLKYWKEPNNIITEERIRINNRNMQIDKNNDKYLLKIMNNLVNNFDWHYLYILRNLYILSDKMKIAIISGKVKDQPN